MTFAFQINKSGTKISPAPINGRYFRLFLERSSVIRPRLFAFYDIRQELLSGIPDIKQFNLLKRKLAPFEDINLRKKHYIKAAEFSNLCRSKGTQGSTIDFLICSVAYLENLLIYTTDKDFNNYKKHLPIKLIK